VGIVTKDKEDGRLGTAPDRSVLMPFAARPGEEEPCPREIGELFSVYHQRVMLWVRRLGGPGMDADDAVQEVFLFAHSRLHGFTERHKLTAWLYRVTENVVRHQRRRFKRQRRHLVDWPDMDRRASEVRAPDDGGPEDEEKRQALELIYKVLDGMSERNRTLIVLFELEEMSGEEIAQLKGAKVATVWVWLHRARAEFRRRLAALQAAPKAQEAPGR
jgi:RNA polymerase sigma-70 factor (ECF subfamily)